VDTNGKLAAIEGQVVLSTNEVRSGNLTNYSVVKYSREWSSMD